MQKKIVGLALVLGIVLLTGVVLLLPAWKKRNDPLNQGKQLYHDGKFEEAIIAYREALKAHPTDSVAGVELGRSLIVLKRQGEAVQTLKQTLHGAPGAVEGWHLLGEACAGSGHPKEAVDAYQHALALDANRVYTHLMLGQAYRDMGKEKEARKEWETVIALDPGNEGKVAQKMINLQLR